MITVDEIAQVLCKASAQDSSNCPFCEKGKCTYRMWSTFRKEATTVLNYINAKNKMLPGLGGSSESKYIYK